MTVPEGFFDYEELENKAWYTPEEKVLIDRYIQEKAMEWWQKKMGETNL